MRRRAGQAPGQVLHPGDVVARRRPHAGAQARRDVRGVRSLRRRAAGRPGGAGAVPRRHALPLAPRAAARRPAAAAAELDRQGRERSAGRRSVEPRPRGARRLADVARAASCTSSAHVPLSRRLLRAAARLQLQPRDVRRSICGVDFDADFADMFEVRGAKRARRGQRLSEVASETTLDLRLPGASTASRGATRHDVRSRRPGALFAAGALPPRARAAAVGHAARLPSPARWATTRRRRRPHDRRWPR